MYASANEPIHMHYKLIITSEPLPKYVNFATHNAHLLSENC